MDHFQLFRRINADPRGYAIRRKQEGAKVIGHFCSYTPQELITAAGALPYRILGSGSDSVNADGYLQAYCCSLVRGGLEDALAGRLDFLEGAVFPHTCDSIQRLSDIWRMNAGFAFHADIIMPVKLNTESAADYMRAVLARFKADLEKGLQVTITETMLADAIRTCNRVRQSLSRLYAIRRQNPLAIGGGDLHAVFKAALVMDRAELADALEPLIADLAPAVRPPFTGKRLVLSGGLCSMPDIYQVVEASGARVVWDDFCTGARYFEGPVDENCAPLEGLAQKYLQRVVCPAKHAGIYSRGQYLLDKARENRADGVIFLYLKFCDPHAFDYPYMKAMLDKEGIPSLMFEIEDQLSSQGQLRTRCEAFMEML
ncbi:MAG: 2-hydroxyacyl-CoA dehydratase [Desulfobacteraceae bacterium]|nr:MAG: 2-hydroxyacyl-CoA dehydratase [Desulfobacteraceae bacterium]